MSNELGLFLPEIFCKVVEEQAFMCGDAIPAHEAPQQVVPCMIASIDFQGPIKGRLRMLVANQLTEILIENLLNMTPESDRHDQIVVDALGELLNVTCGRVVLALMGQQAVVNLSPPKVETGSAEEWSRVVADPGAVAFLIEEQPVVFDLKIEEQQALAA